VLRRFFFLRGDTDERYDDTTPCSGHSATRHGDTATVDFENPGCRASILARDA
jgi:hypothetical protein